MGQSNWTELVNSLSQNDVERGVSLGFDPPPGGGTFVHGWNSLSSTVGAVGKYVNGTAPNADFAPMASGGSITGALLRAGSAQDAGVCLFHALQGTQVTDSGYLLGLSHDEDNPHVLLMKSAPASGLASTSANILRQSAGVKTLGDWVHLRLDVVVQPTGDVLLQVFENDLDEHDSTDPDWQPIAGMADFVDDSLQVFTGSAPLIGGYAGVAFYTRGVARYALADNISVGRQL